MKRFVQRDILFGLLLAFSVAGISNFLQWLRYSFEIGVLADKVLVIAFMFLGAATVPALLNGIRYDGVFSKGLRKPVLLALAGLSGLMASGYFIAIVGLNLEPGIGAGLTEIVDSGLAPVFYLLLVASLGVVQFTRWSVLGGILIGLAMALLLLDTHAMQVRQVAAGGVSLPMLFLLGLSALGALGGGLSMWVFRKLVRENGVSIGGVLLFRYGAPGILFLLLWKSISPGTPIPGPLYPALLLSFIAGAVLMSLVFISLRQIGSDMVTASSVALVPVVAVCVELALARLLPGYSLLRAKDATLGVALFLAVSGILVLNFDPSQKKA